MNAKPYTVTGNKQIAKNSFYLYVRMGVLMIISLLSIRFLLETMGVVDYGIYTVVGGLAVSFSFISQTLVSASQRFFAIDIGKNDNTSLKRTYDAIIVSYLLIILFIILLLETIGPWFIINKMTIPTERLEVALLMFQFSIGTFIVHIITNPFTALIIAYEDMRTYAVISLLEGFLKLLAALSIKWIPCDKLLSYPILLLIVSLIIFAIYFTLCYRNYGSIRSRIKIEWQRIKSVFSYSLWTIFGTMANVANNQGLNLLLNMFFGPIVNAAFSISHQVSGVVSQLANSFFSAVRPPLTKSYSTGLTGHTLRLFFLSSKVIVVLVSIIVVPLYILISDVLTLWLGQVNDNMIYFSRMSLVYAFIISLGAPITTIVQAAGAVKLYHGIVDGFMLLTLPLVYLAFKLGMPPLVAFVTMNIVVIISHFIRLVILKRYLLFSIKEYLVKLFIPSSIILLSVCSFGLYLYDFIDLPIVRFSTICISSVFLVLLGYYISILDSKDKVAIKDIITRRNR